MDRIISLLAALVGLIALGGAILVHTNVDAERQQMATDLAQMRLSIGLTSREPAAAQPEAAPSQQPANDGTAEALLALQDRIAVLERTTRDQAAALEEARTALASAEAAAPASSVAPPETSTEVATLDPSASQPEQSANPKAAAAGGPTTDCIPLGTRFMGTTGDVFPICKTKVVVKVIGVSDGLATLSGPGDLAAGTSGGLDNGCAIMVFSADTSGYAEMRVTCQ